MSKDLSYVIDNYNEIRFKQLNLIKTHKNTLYY